MTKSTQITKVRDTNHESRRHHLCCRLSCVRDKVANFSQSQGNGIWA